MQDLIDQIKAHQAEQPNKEVCGFIVIFDDKFEAMPVSNSSTEKDMFVIDGAAYIAAKIAYRLCGVYHTHLVADEVANEFDIISSEHACLPFLVYSVATDKCSLTIPEYVDADLEGVSKLKERFND